MSLPAPATLRLLRTAALVVAASALVGGILSPAAPAAEPPAEGQPFVVDQRFAPPWWQTAICLPDDWQKTLVAREGGLLYDFGAGREVYRQFQTRIAVEMQGESVWVKQELLSPRVPIVRTFKRHGAVEILEEAFAVTPNAGLADAPRAPVSIERCGSDNVDIGWAKPAAPCEPALRDIMVGFAQPIELRVHAPAGTKATVVFGLCEGWHKEPGKRILNLNIEGKTRKTVDMVAEKGQNVPAVFAFEAQDENTDGRIDVSVTAAPGRR